LEIAAAKALAEAQPEWLLARRLEQEIMANVNLGACEWFVWDLRRSHLLENETLDQVVAAFLMQQPQGEPPALAQQMVEQKLLTPFQAERLLQGKSHDLVLGPYVLLEAVGAGSMGTVYRAVSSKDHKPYAVKVLPRRSTWNARMARRQVTAFEKCKHPAVVPFVDVGTAGAVHYLAWPFVEGESLQSLVQREGKLQPEQAAHLALQVAEGLQVCHQNGLIHGMIKPSNLLLTADQQIHILDFGVGTLLAQGEEESLVDTRSTANVLASGLDCVSPESVLDPTQRTPAGDQYSLGCVLYYCLAGRFPFEGSAAEKLQAHRSKQPDPIRDLNPAVPEALTTVVNRLMQKAPADRYADMKQVVEALRTSAEPKAPAAGPADADATRLASDPNATMEWSPAPADVVSAAPVLNQANISSVGEGIIPPVLAITAAQGPSFVETGAPRKSATPTPPELSITPVASAAPVEEPVAVPGTHIHKLQEADLEILSKPVRSVESAAPIEFFEMPEKGKPIAPAAPKPPEVEIRTPPKHDLPPPMPKPTPLPAGATKILGQASAPTPTDYSVFDLPAVNDPRAPRTMPPPGGQTPDEVIAAKAPWPIPQVPSAHLSLEERFGSRTMTFLAMVVGVAVFVIGYLLIQLVSR
jgi:serine/threonine-protein kinase